MLQVDFYFDYGCPWAYLGFHRLRESAMRVGAEIVYKPLNLKQVTEYLGHQHQDSPARQNHEPKDLAAWADFCGLALKPEVHWPVDTQIAARGALLAMQQGSMPAYSQAVFSAIYVAGEDVADAGTVAALFRGAGMESDKLEVELEDGSLDQGLSDNARELVERGGFGVPTMFVGDQMFFGNDRMPLVEFALGQTSGRRFVMPGQHG